MYQSTIFGTSVRPRAPPNAVPFQTRPVTSWNGRVAISWPAPATPMMTLTAPAAVAALERLAHQRRRCRRTRSCSRRRRSVSSTRCATRSPSTSFGLTKCVMPNFARQRLARRVDVDADDHVGAGHARALHDVEADAAEPEHDDVGARLDLRGVDHRADAGGDAAADVADLVERRVLADLRERDLRQHGVVRERRAAHVVVDRLAADARSGWCRRASGPCPASRGSRCTGWSCATGTTCTARHSGV